MSGWIATVSGLVGLARYELCKTGAAAREECREIAAKR
jgi:hypothetical protein